jgi:hypothetical protein
VVLLYHLLGLVRQHRETTTNTLRFVRQLRVLVFVHSSWNNTVVGTKELLLLSQILANTIQLLDEFHKFDETNQSLWM